MAHEMTHEDKMPPGSNTTDPNAAGAPPAASGVESGGGALESASEGALGPGGPPSPPPGAPAAGEPGAGAPPPSPGGARPGHPSRKALKAEVARLEQDVTRLEQDVARLRDQLLRALADFENYRKRRDREVLTLREATQIALLRDLLPVLDDLDRTVAALEQQTDGEALATGVRLVHGKFHDLLRRTGVMPIPAVGNSFNPEQHEAVAHYPQEGLPANQVIQECERGYMMYERVLRHAKVVVSA